MARGSLRKRALDDSAQDAAVFGSAPANAYFNAKKLKTSNGVSGGQKKTTKKKSKSNEDDDEEETKGEEDDTSKGAAFAVRSVGETAEILRRLDAREDAWRAEDSRRQWPSHERLFAKWAAQMRASFSVLLHGVGSKLTLLQAFAESLPLSDFVVQIHGYLPSVELRDVVSLLQFEVFNMQTLDPTKLTSRSLVHKCRDIADFARAHRQQNFPHVYLIVHSLDGPALRDPKLQASLACLAMAPFVHLIASVDSVNAPALWMDDDAQRFRWVHHRVDTLRPHVRELDLRLSREGKAAEQSISGVRYVLQSLTPTDVATLQTIATQQLACATASTARSRRVDKCADYHAVYLACRKQLLHASMQSMKNSVKCLEDNGLVKLIRVKNVEKLLIPLPDELLKSDILPSKTGKSA